MFNTTILFAAVCEDSDVRLSVGEDYDYYHGTETVDSSYYIDNQLSIGRLELCLNGQWGVACQDYWSDEQASVVCSQLGFARVGKHVVINLMFTYKINTFTFFMIRCYCWESEVSATRLKSTANLQQKLLLQRL